MVLLAHPNVMVSDVVFSSQVLRPKVALTGAKTGRSPKDKRIVREVDSEKNIWWADGVDGHNGSPNYEMDERCDLRLFLFKMSVGFLKHVESEVGFT